MHSNQAAAVKGIVGAAFLSFGIIPKYVFVLFCI